MSRKWAGKRELLAHVLDMVPRPIIRGCARVMGRDSLVCLTYHRVGLQDEFDAGLNSCSVEEFEKQVSWLARRLRVLNGGEVSAYARGELVLGEPCVCITFDDGYADNLPAGEIMARYGVPAVFFVTSGFVGTTTIPDWDRIAYSIGSFKQSRLKIPRVGTDGPWVIDLPPGKNQAVVVTQKIYRAIPSIFQKEFVKTLEAVTGVSALDALGKSSLFMTWLDVKRLTTLGHTIGAHTHSHPILAALPAEAQREEIMQSKDVIEKQLGTPVRLFAYPDGQPGTFSETTKRIIQECGFDAAFSFYGGVNMRSRFDKYDMRRSSVERDVSPSLFRARASFSGILPL